jgi:hypothetical protein
MKKVKVTRIFGNIKQTLGTLTVTDETGIIFTCKTLELPDKDNASQVSCIPEGIYDCVYTKSKSFSESQHKDVFTYELKNVPKRAGIRIHSANFFSQLRGCLALGDSHKDINNDGQLDVVHSGQTMRNFEEVMEYKDFEIEIIKAY